MLALAYPPPPPAQVEYVADLRPGDYQIDSLRFGVGQWAVLEIRRADWPTGVHVKRVLLRVPHGYAVFADADDALPEETFLDLAGSVATLRVEPGGGVPGYVERFERRPIGTAARLAAAMAAECDEATPLNLECYD